MRCRLYIRPAGRANLLNRKDINLSTLDIGNTETKTGTGNVVRHGVVGGANYTGDSAISSFRDGFLD
jgi:hypothetical protein